MVTNKQKINFLRKFKILRNEPCWEWAGARNPAGYGQFCGFGKRQMSAHRISWFVFNGPFDTKLLVLHKCDNPPCVNPYHLYLGNQFDNERDKINRKRHANQKKTHCPRKHKYKNNLRVSIKYGRRYVSRVCLICCRRRNAEYHLKNKKELNTKPLMQKPNDEGASVSQK